MGTENNNGKGLSFAKRIYLPRTLGSAFGLIAVLGALYPSSPPIWMWVAAIVNGLGWPHLAYQLARRARTPYRAEQRNLLWDSVSGGFWAAAMHFNPLPSITILAMMTMDNVAAGGRPLFLRGALAQVLGAGVGAALLGLSWQREVSQAQVWACLPMLTLYPFALGWVCYQLTLKLAEHKRELGALSRTDSLTGLLNHGAWKDLLQLKFHKCRKERCDAVIAIIDVDHFKHINDNYGHIVGDSVLRQLTTELRRALRACDLAGRYGGDEFCVILPHVSMAQANEAMERVRLALHRYRHTLEPQLRVTLSIGLAAFRAEFSEPASWLHEADRALYVAKNNGRNRVSISGLQSPQTVM